MTEHERQHLEAWKMAMGRVGKGTGKYAAKHRRAARENMDQCRSAIPAWIMPICRVAETVRATRNLFDVVIVDAVGIAELRRLAQQRRANDPVPRPFESWFEIDVFLFAT